MTGAGAGETVVVGRILGAWGVQGWVQVYSWTDPPDALFDYQPWYLGSADQPTSLSDWRRSGQRLLARLPGVESPEAAAALAQVPILVSRVRLPEPPAGQYYWHDLIDLEVVNLQGHRWGTITKILPTGAHDVLQILSQDERTVLIPFVADRFVREVDLEAGRVLVDWPEDWEI
ncbi:MAG: ribosome maturation factor RimM [Wenzhouxiangella sp.]|jgi:16S rRNA processing protein RimM|nr:ribosome maturation factor RimM [Wenzhouxiangella sp.]